MDDVSSILKISGSTFAGNAALGGAGSAGGTGQAAGVGGAIATDRFAADAASPSVTVNDSLFIDNKAVGACRRAGTAGGNGAPPASAPAARSRPRSAP